MVLTQNKIAYKPKSEVLLNISGDKSKNIQLVQTDTTKAKNKVTYTFGAIESAVVLK